MATPCSRCTSGARRGNVGETTAVVVHACVGELLGEGGAFAESGTFPVDDVDGADEDGGDAEENGGGVGEVDVAAVGFVGFADVCGKWSVWEVEGEVREWALTGEEWGCWDGENTGEEITRPAVSAGCGCRVWTVGADHIVDGSHVD